MVRVHHKFVIVDGESDNPVVFTGSANFSGNSLHKNDENLLEITECPRLGRMDFAEFLRLDEHYRARASFNNPKQGDHNTVNLTASNHGSKKYFSQRSPEPRTRNTISGTV